MQILQDHAFPILMNCLVFIRNPH